MKNGIELKKNKEHHCLKLIVKHSKRAQSALTHSWRGGEERHLKLILQNRLGFETVCQIFSFRNANH